MAMANGDLLAEAGQPPQAKLRTEKRENYATATPFLMFILNIYEGKKFGKETIGLFRDGLATMKNKSAHLAGVRLWLSKRSPRVRTYELIFSSDSGKSFLGTLGINARNQDDLVGSTEIFTSPVKVTTSSSKNECNRTRMFIEVVGCPETLSDDETKKKIENFLGANVSLCEVSRDAKTKGKWSQEEWSDWLASCAGKCKEPGTTKESETKPTFGHSTPALEKRVSELEKELEKKDARIKNVNDFYAEKLRQKERNNNNLVRKLATIQRELQETQEELGRVNFENDRLINEKKHNSTFRQIFNLRMKEPASRTDSGQPSRGSSDEGLVTPEEDSPVTDEELSVEEPSVEEGASCSYVNASSVQESRKESNGREEVSLTNIPTTAVERSIYNNYKLLLLIISRLLLASDVCVLKQWARSEFSIDATSGISEIFRVMDRKRIITAVNLDQLKYFFEKIGRFDVVYLIECFLQGDYAFLRNSGVTGPCNIGSKNSSSIWDINNCTNSQNSNRNDRYSTVSSASPANGARLPTERTISDGVSKNSPAHTLKCSSGLPDGFNKWPSFVGNCGGESCQQTVVSPTAGALVVTDGTGIMKTNNDTKREAVRGTIQSDSNGSGGNSCKRGYSGLKGGSRGTRVDSGSNGEKLSKFERPATTSNRRPSRQKSWDDLGDDEEWLCNHYKRRCYVKFDCCNKFWPCHRCHNNQTKCGQTKLKSRDTKFVKCVSCGKEQQFGANGEYCIQCNAKFCNYFCAICKHLTGKDDHPYHCDKCGICRIHGDRSFHCDVCGVCLDVQLRGNHKCRAGSAHDECCICLEDAFTGCQILPCSHKVHKECATQMIRRGITRCPICRESFAHKLERRTQPPKKPAVKQ